MDGSVNVPGASAADLAAVRQTAENAETNASAALTAANTAAADAQEAKQTAQEAAEKVGGGCVLEITFASAFSGRDYTVTGPDGESYTGTVPTTLKESVGVKNCNSAYTVTCDTSGGGEYSASVTTGPYFGQYSVELTTFSATLTVTTSAGAAVTITNGTKSQNGTAPSSGVISFTVKTAGTWSVSATYDGVSSNTATVNATTNGGAYNTSVSFIVLTVTVDSGSSVTVSKGSVSKQATSTGTATFYLPSTGTWTVTATKSGRTATDTISISSYSAYSLTMNYYQYVGVKIQMGSSATDPESAVTYIGDAVGMSAGYDAWKDHAIFKNIRPCLLKDGVVQYYLDPTNLALKADGTAATINSISAGDVMVEIPKLGYKMTTDGRYHYIYVTDDPNADGYCYRAHALESEGDCDKIYIGAYLAYMSSGNLYSISGVKPTAERTLGNFRTYATARGTGYQLLSFYPLTLLQCLYLIMYKDRNGQSALGRGYIDNNRSTTWTGNTNAKGVCFGETSGKHQMCFLNIEDFWGNLLQRIDGIICNSSYSILTAIKSFNDIGSGYPYTKTSGVTSNLTSYISEIQGTNEGGFVGKDAGGSATTFYADYFRLFAGRPAEFGGCYDDGDSAGPFYLSVGSDASNADTHIGARLIYKHKAS